MRITLELDEAELAHTLEALGGVAEILERRSDQLVAAVVIREVVAKIRRAVREAE